MDFNRSPTTAGINQIYVNRSYNTSILTSRSNNNNNKNITFTAEATEMTSLSTISGQPHQTEVNQVMKGNDKSNASIIVGVFVGILLMVLIAIGVGLLYFKR